jgi:hypothetical protein
MGILQLDPARPTSYAGYLASFKGYSLLFPQEAEQFNRPDLMASAPATVYNVQGPQGPLGFFSPLPGVISGSRNTVAGITAGIGLGGDGALFVADRVKGGSISTGNGGQIGTLGTIGNFGNVNGGFGGIYGNSRSRLGLIGG